MLKNMETKKNVTIKLSEPVHKLMRLHSIQHNVTIQKIVEEAIINYVSKKH